MTYNRTDGFQLSEDPAVWMRYERAVFKAELHRIANFIEAAIAPHAERLPKDEWARLALEQVGGVKAALEILSRMEL
ncbi:hypothetical protein ADK86_24340 [Streptomyces sp. NRRL F-5755]|uniref:hypothetical protein n=1 Tax=Streptomyces sp. NRRL F-5755 TaxID=1519475 RepID=UPI0006AE9113|nr:hypothetical protein [Streptomyces sp. NRRL F-5755]KOT91088.1 hypothetical protein ADK86_24340 [Streptomyces sp. NRRL F-5755]